MDLLRKGTRFSISLDEYTSSRNRRLMNINLHTKEKFWNLGMQRIKGSMPAQKVVELVYKKLLEFGINQTRLEQENSCEIVHTLPNSQLKQVTDIMLDDLESAIRQSTTTNVKFPNQKNLYQTTKMKLTCLGRLA